MKLRLRLRASKAEQVYDLHPDYVMVDLVHSFDQAILEHKRIAVITSDDEEVRLDLKRYGAMALSTET